MARLVLLLAALVIGLGAMPATDALAATPPKQKKSSAKRTTCKTAKKAAKRKSAKRCRKAAKKKPAVKKQPAPKPPAGGVRPPATPAPSAAPAPPSPAADPAPPAPAPKPPAEPAPPARPLPSFDFGAAPNPVTVDGTADGGRAASEYVGWMGGTITATGADGAKYELTIPEGALVDDTRITVAPLLEVDGLPFGGGLRAGAELKPDGLRFLKPATLKITGGPSIDPALETGFAYHGDGKDLHLSPMVRDPQVHGFTVQHFSAYGIAHATDAERRAQLVRTTESTERQLQQIVAQELQLDRQHQLGLPGGAPMRQEVIEGALRSYHDQVLKPLMDQALTDDGLVGRAINRHILWLRTVELMTDDDFMAAEIDARQAQFLQIMENAAERSYQRCMAGNIGEVPVLMSWDRQLALLGIPSVLADRLRKCARFEVDLETEIRQDGGFLMPEGPERWRGHLTAEQVPLTFQGNWAVRGQGAFDYDAFSVTIPPHEPGTGCWQGGGDWERSGTVTFSDLHGDFNWVEDADGDQYQLLSGDVVDWKLTMVPLMTREFVLLSDCGEGTGPGGWTTWLGFTFNELHEDPARPDHPAELTGWQPAGPATWKATYERTRTLTDGPTHEDTTVSLRHTPDPGA